MKKIFNKYNTIIFVFLGLVIQYSIFLKLLSLTKNLGLPGMLVAGSIIYSYFIFYQWVGYALQLIIVWFISKKVSRVLEIFLITIVAFYISFSFYTLINKRQERISIDNQMKKDKTFYSELEKLEKKLPKNIVISNPKIKFSCPTLPSGGANTLYDSITISFIADFSLAEDYYIDFSYYLNNHQDKNKDVILDKTKLDKRSFFKIEKSGEYYVDWTFSGYYFNGKFIKSGSSKVNLELYHIGILNNSEKTKISTKIPITKNDFILPDISVIKNNSDFIRSSDYKCPMTSEVILRKK